MPQLPDLTRNFWCAAYFWRRAPYRNRATAIRILRHLADTTQGRVQTRAADIVKEIDDEHRRRQG